MDSRAGFVNKVINLRTEFFDHLRNDHFFKEVSVPWS